MRKITTPLPIQQGLKKIKIKLGIPTAAAVIMLIIAGLVDYPLVMLCVLGAIVAAIFSMANVTEALYHGRARTQFYLYCVMCLTILFMVNVPLAIILALPPCGILARKHRTHAHLSSDFVTALKDNTYRMIIIAMLVLVAAAALYGFKAVPKIMQSPGITMESFSRTKANTP